MLLLVVEHLLVVEVQVDTELLVTDLVHYEDQHCHVRQQEHIRLQLVLVVMLSRIIMVIMVVIHQ